MTNLFPEHGAASPTPAALSRRVLDLKIALRQARLSELEIAMTAACEDAALRIPVDREHGFRLIVNINSSRS